MKRHVIFAGTLALAVAGVAAAQSQTQSSQSPSSQAAGQAQSVTVTGCLIASGAPGTAASASSAVTPGAFMLMNSGDGSKATEAVGTSGSTAANSPAASGSYTLMGGHQEELQRYANSRVEIIGTIEPTGITSSPSPGASATPGTAGTAGTAGSAASGAAAPQQLRITSVRQVSGSCGGGL